MKNKFTSFFISDFHIYFERIFISVPSVSRTTLSPELVEGSKGSGR
jgi:hypothetical protein